MPALHRQPEVQILEELSSISIAEQVVYEEIIAQRMKPSYGGLAGLWSYDILLGHRLVEDTLQLWQERSGLRV